MGTVASLMFIVGGLYMLWGFKAFHKVPNEVFVFGEIVDLKRAGRHSGHYAILKYSVDGQEYTIESDSSAYFYRKGNQIKVYYDANNPSNCYTKPTMSTYVASFICLAMGLDLLYVTTLQFLI